MTKWNDIPFNENDTPAQKAEQFDAQIRENGGDPHPKPQVEGDWAPYGEDRRKK